jgi:S-DNA-T family DNA segregation ATPase FtsK/SpoIIIE
VAETKQASISMVQRRLRIGYNRAARIVEMMEHEGMISPSDGTSKPREIYMDVIHAYLNSQLTR